MSIKFEVTSKIRYPTNLEKRLTKSLDSIMDSTCLLMAKHLVIGKDSAYPDTNCRSQYVGVKIDNFYC